MSTSVKFKTKLGSIDVDVFNTKVLGAIMDAFDGENMETQNCVLSYKISLSFYDYTLAIEVDESIRCYRNINKKIKRQEAIEKKFNCKFIRIDPDRHNFIIFKAIIKIHRHNKKSSKRSLINRILRGI